MSLVPSASMETVSENEGEVEVTSGQLHMASGSGDRLIERQSELAEWSLPVVNRTEELLERHRGSARPQIDKTELGNPEKYVLEEWNPNLWITRFSRDVDMCPHSAIADKSLPAEVSRRQVPLVNPGNLRRSSKLHAKARPSCTEGGVSRLPRPTWLQGSNPGAFSASIPLSSSVTPTRHIFPPLVETEWQVYSQWEA